MIKVEAIKEFTLNDFNKLKNIERKSKKENGRLFVGDTFECTQEMADYLMGNNRLNETVVKIVEVEPEKKETENIAYEEIKKTTKPKKRKK